MSKKRYSANNSGLPENFGGFDMLDSSHLSKDAYFQMFALNVDETDNSRTARLMIGALGMRPGFIQCISTQTSSSGSDEFLEFVLLMNGNIQTRFKTWEKKPDNSYEYTIEVYEAETNPLTQLTRRLVPLRIKQLTGLVNGCFPFDDDRTNRLPQLSNAWNPLFKKEGDAIKELSYYASERNMLTNEKTKEIPQHPIAWLASQQGKKTDPKDITYLVRHLWKIYRTHEVCDSCLWISEGFLAIEQAMHWGEQPQNSGRDVFSSLKKLHRGGYLEQCVVDTFHYYRPVGLTTPPRVSMLGYRIVSFLLGKTSQPMLNSRQLDTITQALRDLELNGVLVPEGPDKKDYRLMAGDWICQPGQHPIASFQFSIREDQAIRVPDLFKKLATEFKVCEPYLETQKALEECAGRKNDGETTIQNLRQQLASLEEEQVRRYQHLQELKEQLP